MATIYLMVLYPQYTKIDTTIVFNNVDTNANIKYLKEKTMKELNFSETDNEIDLVFLGSVLKEETLINELDLKLPSPIHIIIKDLDKKTYRTFPKFSDDEIQRISKAYSKLQYSNFRKLMRPEAAKAILDEFPEFRKDDIAMIILKDPVLMSSMQHIETLQKFNEHHRVLLAAHDIILKTINEIATLPRDSVSAMLTDDLSDSSSSSDNGGPSTSNERGGGVTHDQLATAIALASSSSSLNSLANIAQRNLSETQSSDLIIPSTSGTSSSVSSSNRITASMFSDALSQALNNTSASIPQPPIITPPTEVPSNEVTYASQLEQMRDIGLIDEHINMQALLLCNGDVDAAINLIFSGAIA